MKYTLLYFAFFIFLFSCKKEESSIHSGLVQITEFTMPDSVKAGETIQIKAKAVAYDGCWKNLHFILNKNNKVEYNLEAWGNYESKPLCFTVLVVKDTSFNFSSDIKGKYVFNIRQIDSVDKDTLVVY